MTAWCRKLVLALALAVMPLQGIAASLWFMTCHGSSGVGEVHEHAGHGGATHEQAAHDHAGDHHVAHDEGTQGSDGPSHLCCHMTGSGMPVTALAAVDPEFSDLNSQPRLLRDLFVPDRPQRPPLA